MISREHYAKDILQLLGMTFSKNLNQHIQSDLLLEDSDKVQESELKLVTDQEDDSHGKKQIAVTALSLAELTNQVNHCPFISFNNFQAYSALFKSCLRDCGLC